ncbi:MAG: DUF302 domain-containing protein [Aquificaceae bacterium]
MLITVESKKSLEELKRSIEEQARTKGFGVMAVHDVTKTLESKGMPIDYGCVIVEVCSPKHAKAMLDKNPQVSTAMPCRISIIDQGDKRFLSTMSPMAMLDMFNMQKERAIAEEVEGLIKDIVEGSV